MSTARLPSFAAALAAFSLAALVGPGSGPAQAEKIVARPVSHVSKDSLKQSCASAGGEYGEFGEDYWGQKGNDVVACNQRKCTGTCTADARPPAQPWTSPADVQRLPSLGEEVE